VALILVALGLQRASCALT